MIAGNMTLMMRNIFESHEMLHDILGLVLVMKGMKPGLPGSRASTKVRAMVKA